jgi:hypothetical protein
MPAVYDRQTKQILQKQIVDASLMVCEKQCIYDVDLRRIAKKNNVTQTILYRLCSKKNLNIIRICDVNDANEPTTPQKIYVRIICETCKEECLFTVSNFKSRTYPEKILCAKHYLKYVTSSDMWRKKNSNAQLLSQNKPEVKAKQILAQKRRHARSGMTEIYQKIGKKLWDDTGYREKVSNSLREKWKDKEYAKKVMENSCGAFKSRYQGNYYGIRYQSLAELSFIVWSYEQGLIIRRFDLSPIAWIDENEKSRSYYPDFIINDTTIVEVKANRSGYGLRENDENLVKIKYNALVEFCRTSKYSARMFFATDINNRKAFYRKAKKIHEQNHLEKNS